MPGTNDPAGGEFLRAAYARLRDAVDSWDGDCTLPTPRALEAAALALPRPGSPSYLAGMGAEAAIEHLHGELLPALTGQNLSGRYYGFVTGSTLPVAEAADNMVTAMDQNVQVHLPAQTVCTDVEDAALAMLASLLRLDPKAWPGRTFSTGATASNILGLACAREAVIAWRLAAAGPPGAGEDWSPDAVGQLGLLRACAKAGISHIQVLTCAGHSSLSKAASIVGLGRDSVKELPLSAEEPYRLDMAAVEREAAREGVATIISISAGEVNTGRFAVVGRQDMEQLRAIADRYKAWIHVDGAFGIFARALPRTSEFACIHDAVSGLDLADSITGDGHKILNVPYDNGFFFARNATVQSQVFKNTNAAYLAPSGSGSAPIQSPLNIGMENSRRFRALPVYAVLVSEGRGGLEEMLARMVRMARRVAAYVRASPHYELLPDDGIDLAETTHIVVLFKAKDETINKQLVNRINATRKMYVSPTVWRGMTCTRLAVSSWKVDVDKDMAVVEDVLGSIALGQ
ncbi:hypothetical protein MAPG_07659 [Magnaporthiopsis poae ATCC 64411]|uniref:Pyridoxal-dependent decarboxylase n=1 Tax=Magnaporthiopsis poae (strain ATCC 64411 / 73-15) TaxID=644358 RepID=A0A0C4E593_MAGP6|nr:hypothetical protein MAPG_07659 [Magnaporthiopsis poae ATCC 64411]